jgi:hypothetical protein
MMIATLTFTALFAVATYATVYFAEKITQPTKEYAYYTRKYGGLEIEYIRRIK